MPALPLLLAAGLTAAAITSTVPQPPAGTLSTHARLLEAHRNDPPAQRTFLPPTPTVRSKTQKIVYGYLPYWTTNTASLRWDLLSHVADFSLEMNASGTFTAVHGWPDSALVATAHQAGVKVEIVVTLFNSTALATFLSSPANRSAGIDTMIDQLEAGGADGISIDFEGVPGSQRANLVTFFSELRSRLTSRGHPNAGISVAAPAVDWSDAWDVSALLDSIDVYFIMGYDFFWSGSTVAGPSGIFRTDATWRSATGWSELRSVATTASRGGEAKRGQVVLGVPYYGAEYLTSAGTWPSAASSHVGSVTYSKARQAIVDGTPRVFDANICQPALIWQSGGWHQAWYEDEQSLRCKYDFVSQQELGGTGMWALGYDSGYPELWNLIEEYFTAPQILGEGSREAPIAVASFPYQDTRDTSQGGYRYFNYYSCAADMPEYGREFVYQLDLCQPGSLHLAVEASIGDPDLHLLSGLREADCIERNDKLIDRSVQPGRYYVSVDTYVSNAVEQEGPYTLSMTFTPDPGSTGCANGTTCQAGTCVCSGGLEYCAGACVDTMTDPAHCGTCTTVCSGSHTCESGVCVGEVSPDAGEEASVDPDASLADAQAEGGSPEPAPQPAVQQGQASGCACGIAGAGKGPSTFALGLAATGLLLLRRWRRKATGSHRGAAPERR